MKLKKYLNEGINDKGIFHAIFMAGNPGSGKTYTYTSIKSGQIEPKVVATDKFFKLFGDEWDKIWVKETGFKDKINLLTQNRLYNYFNGMLPIVVDSTSSNAESMFRRQKLLESLGYDVGMVFVNTSLETSLSRASEREKETGRHVPPDFIEKSYKKMQELKNSYRINFKFFMEVNNSEGELTNSVIKNAFNKVKNFYSLPINNITGKETLNTLIKNGWKYLVPNIYKEEYLKGLTKLWHKE